MTEQHPVTVLTGFLGSGKTTLINRMLRHPDMPPTAVLVNEFGEIGLDHLLVEHVDEETILIGSGCLCCAVREDLIAGLDRILKRQDCGRLPSFEHILVETSGLADPAPIVHTLLSDERITPRCRVNSVVTAVDAVFGQDQLHRNLESQRQAAIADRLVITKGDLTDDDGVRMLKKELRSINAAADLFVAPVEPHGILATTSNDSASWIGLTHTSPPEPQHDHTIMQVTLRSSSTLRIDRVVDWIDSLLLRHGDKILRMKGVLDLEGSDVPVAVHGVQHVFYPLRHLDGWPDNFRQSAIVLIGHDLPQTVIEGEFKNLAIAQNEKGPDASSENS